MVPRMKPQYPARRFPFLGKGNTNNDEKGRKTKGGETGRTADQPAGEIKKESGTWGRKKWNHPTCHPAGELKGMGSDQKGKEQNCV